jgi:LysR family glycine cleavage system transcriptional activator
VDLHITTDWVHSLREGQSHDCLVVFDTAPWPKVDCEHLMNEKHVMVSHPSLWRHDVPPTLSQQTLLHILNGIDRLPLWECWIELHKLAHIDPKPGLNFSTLDQVINATLSGAGVAIVDEHMIRPELSSGALRQFNDLHMDGPHGYWFVDVAKDGEHKAVVRLLRDWLSQEVASGSH